jgi:hypothetical protein
MASGEKQSKPWPSGGAGHSSASVSSSLPNRKWIHRQKAIFRICPPGKFPLTA